MNTTLPYLQKKAKRKAQSWTLYVSWIYFTVISYFYVLPLGRLNTVTTTDLRLYDLAIAGGLLFVVLPNSKDFVEAIKKYPWIKFYMLFSVWCAVTLIMVYLLAGSSQMVVAIARLGRFVSYGLVHVAILLFITQRKQLIKLTWLFFLLIAFEAILSTLQSLGFVPQLWPLYWLVAYGSFPVATLGPHHLHLATVVLMGICLGWSLIITYSGCFLRLVIAVAIGAMIYSTFAVASRSGWFGLGIIAFYLVYSKNLRGLSPLFILALGIFVFNLLGGEEVSQVVVDSFDQGVVLKYEADGLMGLSTRRVQLWQDLPSVLWQHPWVLISGSGIQNSVSVLRYGNAMHNNYLHVLVETGIWGTVLYVSMLVWFWRRSVEIQKKTDSQFGQNLAVGFRTAFLIILFLNLFNETFYMQYSLFSLTGQIMVFAGLALHPLWLQNDMGITHN